jgi:hypothetical protein
VGAVGVAVATVDPLPSWDCTGGCNHDLTDGAAIMIGLVAAALSVPWFISAATGYSRMDDCVSGRAGRRP